MLWTPGRNTSLRTLKAGDVPVAARSPIPPLGFSCEYHGRQNRTCSRTVRGLAIPSFRFFHVPSSDSAHNRIPTKLYLGSPLLHGRSSSTCFTLATAMVPTPASFFCLSSYHCNLEKTAQHDCVVPASDSEKTPLDLPIFDHVQVDCLVPLQWGLFCGSALSYGRLLHTHLIKTSSNTQSLTEMHLVQMYCKCGCLEDAYTLFNALHPRHLVTAWNAMISSLINCSRISEACQLFDQMLIEGVPPDKVTYATLTSTCRNSSALLEGHRIHARVRMSDLCTDVIVGTALVIMYSKCGSLEKARLTFDSMPSHDVVAWTALISAYVQHGKNKWALEVFSFMQHENISPSKVTFISLLSACTCKDTLHVGKELHAYLKKCGFESDMVIGNALLSMYGKCGSVECARSVFDLMLERNVVSWNTMITAYAQNDEGKEALYIARHMQQETLPDDVTFVSMLDACAGLTALCEGKQIHSCIIGSRFETNIILGNTLIHMYGKCRSLEEAAKAFEMMHHHDEITWNALISVFANKGQGAKALELFHRMQQEGLLPNKITFVSVFSACADHGALATGKQMHSSIAGCEFELDVIVGTAIVNMYGKFHSPSCAQEIFDRMPIRNVVCWTAMISTCAQNGRANEAFALFDLVRERHDSVLWNAIIAAFSQNCRGKKALSLFEQMLQEGVLPDRVTFVSSLDAAASEAVLEDGKRLHTRIVGMPYEQDSIIHNALINMYGRCGSLKIAWKQFELLHKRDVFAWSSMISAFAQIGLGKEALQVFTQMRQEGVVPDKVTFVNVLSACSRAGLVREGCGHFASMSGVYAITPTVDHYNCMVDLLGRSGQLGEAEKLISNMRVPASIVTWLTLLSACRSNVDVKRGVWAAESVFKMDPNNATPYIMLSHIYTAAGQPIDAANVIWKMKCNCLNPKPLSPMWNIEKH